MSNPDRKKHLSDVGHSDLILKYQFTDRADRDVYLMFNLQTYRVGVAPLGSLRVPRDDTNNLLRVDWAQDVTLDHVPFATDADIDPAQLELPFTATNESEGNDNEEA